jgi:hypothetical protein
MRKLPLGDRLRVRTPCKVPGTWDTLPGGERVRFCAPVAAAAKPAKPVVRIELDTWDGGAW